MKDRGEFTEQVNERPYADVPDGGRLVIAVTAAMLLGVACGLWLSARLASAAMETPAPSALSRPALNAGRSETAAAESATEEREVVSADVSAAVDGLTLPTAAAEPDGEKEAVSTPPRAPADKAALGRGVSNAARPAAAVEAERPGETNGRKNSTAKAAASPCPLYASAGALTVRDGVEAALVLGGPGGQGRVTVTTPDWADIAVFSEGQAGGNRGWVKYSVRSVSRRAGLFSVRVNSHCGSLTIPVRVVRP
ncbi:MAG TPA: hypothetical protein VM914_04840 [Pyrinomonadaceae bacterium]|jgi:hypothetical protein|nr:hypothetical protein [Pyrinomonadaceae bacterium]